MPDLGENDRLWLGLLPQWRRVEPPKPDPAPQQPPANAAPQDRGFVFRADTTWVRVDVQAGTKESLIPNLTKEDFVVLDEGVPQPVGYFGRESEQLDLLLLLDVSGSMRRFLEQVAATAQESLKQLHTADRAAVMLFGRRSELRQEFTTEFPAVEKAIRAAARPQDLGSGTQINPAVIDACTYVKTAAGQGRRAVLILTDNNALHYQSPDEAAIRALLAADTVLNGIAVGRAERPEEAKPGQYTNPDFTPADIWHLAEATGGEVLKADNAGRSFREMIERIRTRYTLQYRMPAGAVPGTFRRIRVELSPEAHKRYPKAWVRARGGYYVQ